MFFKGNLQPESDKHAGWHKTPLIAIDIETTTLFPKEAKIASFAAVTNFDIDSREVDNSNIRTWKNIFIDVEGAMTDRAFQVNRLSNEFLKNNGAKPLEGISEIASVFEFAIKNNIPVIGQNIQFDLTVIVNELLRYNILSPSLENIAEFSFHNLKVIDTLFLDQARRFPTGYKYGSDNWERIPRKLDDLANVYGVVNENAHDAKADAATTLKIAISMAKRDPLIAAIPKSAITNINRLIRIFYFQWLKGETNFWFPIQSKEFARYVNNDFFPDRPVYGQSYKTGSWSKDELSVLNTKLNPDSNYSAKEIAEDLNRNPTSVWLKAFVEGYIEYGNEYPEYVTSNLFIGKSNWDKITGAI